MRKIIAAINMTLDGFCDHTAVDPDEEIHRHYAELLDEAGILVYGRVTYQLMEDYWPSVVEHPTGDKGIDEFALSIDRVPKLVFSRTLKQLNWKTASLAAKPLEEELSALRQQPGKDIFVGSPGLIAALTEAGLIDEYQICVHPVIAGSGLPLFRNISHRIALKLLQAKPFASGAVILYYGCSDQSGYLGGRAGE